MTKKQYITNDIVKFDYSEIWKKSDDEMYTDTPLRNDEVIELLNENEQLKQELNSFKPVVFKDTSNNETILLYAKEYGDVDD